jgi:hypothetical protein
MVIHRVIHRLWITKKESALWVAMRPSEEYFRPCSEMDAPAHVHNINAVLQRFSARRTGMARVREGGPALEIAGWRCRLRIYSRRSTEYFGVPVEEFNEAYLSAKSP